jgi:hypothetical protein
MTTVPFPSPSAKPEPARQAWRHVWRKGVAPLLSPEALAALAAALAADDPRLLQGATTTPPPLNCVGHWPVEAACVLGYCGWQGDGLQTVAEVEEFFARLCMAVDFRLGEPGGVRWFLNWWDETPRPQARRLLLAEIAAPVEDAA